MEILENQLEEQRRQMVKREHIEKRVDVLAKRVEDQQTAADAPFFHPVGEVVPPTRARRGQRCGR